MGREAERAQLQRAIEELGDGLGVVLAVTGEAGIGKTRLVRDVVRAADGRIGVLEGHGASYASGFPLWPVRDLLRGWLDMPVAAGEAQVRLELKARLAELFGEPGERYVFLASVLGLRPESDGAGDLIGELSRENVQERTVEALSGLFAAIAERRPLLVVLDDLHWADAATLALVEGLLEVTESASVGLALLYRSERDSGAWRLAERARQRFPHRFQEVELRALPADAAARLADEAARGTLPGELGELLVERSGGNPFFVEEAVHDLLERDVLERNGDGFVLRVDAAQVAVPVAVTSALQARLDRLGPEARQVVSIAAVIGRRFGVDLLGRVLPADTVRAGLVELLRAELIAEQRRRPVPEYRFRHGLVQEVAYGSLLEADRRAAHGQVADALEAIAAESDTPTPAPVLARHLAEADLPERAANALIAAGDLARAIWATDEAVAHYREARRFLGRLGDEGRSRDTLFKIALVHHLAFDYPSAETAYDEAFACKPDTPDQPPATERLSTAMTKPAEMVPGFVNVHEASSLTDLFYRGLLAVDRDLNVVPSLAENFRVSADGLSYLFQLRSGLRWSDGEPLTTEDFAYAWRQMRAQGAPTAFLLDDVADMIVHDEHTLEVVLHEPRNYFPYLLAHTSARPWPRHACEERGPEWRRPPFITNGPYRVIEHSEAGLVAEADPLWAGPRGNVQRIDVEFVPMDQHVARGLAGWANGDYDVLTVGLRPPEPDPATQVTIVPGLITVMLEMQPRRPELKPVEVRRAIAAAMDNVELDAASPGFSRPAQPAGLLPPAMPGHSNRSGVPHDLEAARALLAQAGHPDGEGLPRLTLDARKWMIGVAEQLARQLARVGIEVDVCPVETELGTVEDDLRTTDADLTLNSWVADYADPDGFFRGLLEGGDCPVRTDDESLQMLAEARRLRDHDRRLAVYQALDRRLVQELAILVPIGYPRTSLLARPWVAGAWANSVSAMRLSDVVVKARPDR